MKGSGLFSRRYLLGILGIIVIFSIGLVLFFMFSADYGDGLEKTMENAGVEEGEAVYSAPLDYGENYPASFVMGAVGFAATLGFIYVYAILMRRGNEAQKPR